MLTLEQIEQILPAAYRNLYDLVWLRSSPLADALGPETEGSTARERAWQVHDMLLAVVEDLGRSCQSRPESTEYRQHQGLKLRFVDGLTVDQVATDLCISRRVYYRDQKSALAAAAQILEERLAGPGPEVAAGEPEPGSGTMADGGLLRAEAFKAMGSDHSSDLLSVVESVAGLLGNLLRSRGLGLELHIADDCRTARVDPGLLRQMVMTSVGQIAEHSCDASLVIRADRCDAGAIRFSVACDPPEQTVKLSVADREQARDMLLGLAQVTGCTVIEMGDERRLAQMSLSIPTLSRPVVLVVDDNADMVELLKRYLAADFEVGGLHPGEDVIAAARRVQPQVITLDLMMPKVDGWVLLQRLKSHPETAAIPVLVCSVLKARDLAIAMGATAFVEKPVSEGQILSLLHTLVN